MLAKEATDTEPQSQTLRIERPVDPASTARPHLMLVKPPRLTARGHAWAQERQELSFDAIELSRIMRLERMNLG